MRLFSSLEGFSRRNKFSLLDSLPALSPDLGELEAFKLTVDSAAKTNSDRSVWLGDSLRRISMEFYTGKSVFDSTTLYLWTSDSVVESRPLKNQRSILWDITYRRKVTHWTEVVGVYISRPRFFDFQSQDASVSVFEQVEGKTIHVVSHRYRDRLEKPLAPDTAYPSNNGEELQLLARGSALAIINPTTNTVVTRVIRIAEKRWDICSVPGNTIQVYRSLLKGVNGPVLAYTSAGIARSLIVKEQEVPAAYFWLAR